MQGFNPSMHEGHSSQDVSNYRDVSTHHLRAWCVPGPRHPSLSLISELAHTVDVVTLLIAHPGRSKISTELIPWCCACEWQRSRKEVRNLRGLFLCLCISSSLCLSLCLSAHLFVSVFPCVCLSPSPSPPRSLTRFCSGSIGACSPFASVS